MFEKLKNMSIQRKLALVVGVMAVPILVLVGLFVRTTNVLVGSTQDEINGLEYLSAVMNLSEHVQAHRDLSAAVLAGDAGQASRIQALYPVVDSDFAALEPLEEKYAGTFGTSEKLSDIKKAWATIRQRGTNTTARESLAAHADLSNKLIDLVRQVGDKSSLILDPELDAYYLMDPVVVQLPLVIERISALRSLVMQSAVKGRTPEEQAQAVAVATEIQRNFVNLQRSFATASAANKSLDRAMGPAVTAAIGAAENFLGRVTRDANGIRSVNDAYEAGTAALDAFHKLHDTSSTALAGLLDVRVAGFRQQQIVQALVGLLALGAVGFLAYRITLGITAQVDAIMGLFSSIGIGDFGARAPVISSDELGMLTQSLNVMLDNTLSLIQSQEERQQLEDSIQKLTAELSVAAAGDLTVRAEVDNQVTESIAQSFNQMIGELRAVIARVHDTTTSVTSSAGEVQVTTEHLATGSESQAHQIIEASAAVDEMAVSIQQVSANAANAASVADQALETSKKGAGSVQKTIEGMGAIRQQVQQTSKRIKRLGESSQEIGEIVQLIGDIADRTSILALNASIQAAMAGEAGKGFAVVAEEVERLAERSTEATKKISSLIKSIQTDTNDAIMAMEETTREVVGGSNLANEAGQNLLEIEKISGQLAELIQSISMASKQQSRGSESVVRSMGQISDVTQQTAAGAKQAAVSIRRLSSLADELRSSMDRFKLPRVAA
ncbi:MAG: methyl-accepting chemotaxis protein [Bryobacteraceae bacterium]